MQVNTQMNQVAYAKYKTNQTEGAKVQQQVPNTEQAHTQKAEKIKSAQVEKTASTPSPVKSQKADTVEISQGAQKLYAESVKQKEAETVKADAVQKQVVQSAEAVQPKEKVSDSAQNLASSLTASQSVPVVRTDAQAPAKDNAEKKATATDEGSKAK